MVITLLLTTLLLELLLYSRPLWQYRLPIIIVLTFTIPGVTASLLMLHPNWVGIVVALSSLGRLGNLFRIAQARMHNEYLRNATRRTSLTLGLAQLLLASLLTGVVSVSPPPSNLPASLAILQVIVAAALLLFSVKNIVKTRYAQGSVFYSDKELPTVSLLIPARNETNDLEECLRSALASDYPKLEIIVLDDCSQAKTSDIIKGFAHDGVRFVRGEEPSEHWLAKNQAYEKLRSEASGELLLFCGVDVRFGSHAIKALVTELQARDKQMISVLPHRLSGSLAGAFIQPMRYWWELALPRKIFNRPPVLGTCWLIRSKSIEKLGGFKANSHSILPEAYFARELIKSSDYSFIRANDVLDIQTFKSFSEQRATALRTRYPQLRRRPENVLLLVALELLFLAGPFIGLTYGFITNNESLLWLSALSSGLLVVTHVLIVQITSPANTVIALINFPVEVLTEVVIALMSMTRYEFGTVEWKDRNVCIPVMHVIPHLPKD